MSRTAALAAFLLICSGAADAQPTEYQVKAAFLLNFTRFVEWPAASFATADSPLTICVLGRDPFGDALDQVVAGESVAGRRIAVRRIQEPLPAQLCQILFLARGVNETARILNGLSPGILTVGEGDEFLRDGGMIRFVQEGRRVRFDINLRAASRGSLTLSARLLAVARSVRK